jgi:hypothetical protein
MPASLKDIALDVFERIQLQEDAKAAQTILTTNGNLVLS